MHDRQRLFRAICDNPDDVPLRLIFADWLEDHGDPLGEFVRVQLRLAELESRDENFIELELRERELLLVHRDGWQQGVEPFLAPDYLFGGFLASDVFERGLPENVILTPETFIRRHEELFRVAPVRSVRFLDARGHLQELLRCPALGRLHTLEFDSSDGNELGPDEAQALAACPHLSGLARLSLQSNRIGAEGVYALVTSRNLRSLSLLDLSRNLIGDEGGEALASLALPNLRSLDLAENALTSRGLRVLDSAPAGQLTALSLNGNEQLREEGASRVAASRLSGALRSLHLDNTGLRREGASELVRSRLLEQVIDLDLGSNEIGQRGLAALAESPRLSNVRRLNLRSCEVGPGGIAALLGSTHLPRLSWLDLSHNRITDRCAKPLACSPFAGSLHHLDLAANSLTDAGVQVLAKAATFHQLRRLHVNANNLDVAGMQALVEAKAFASVISLNLSSNTTQADPFCFWLAGAPSARRLRELLLGNSGITARGAAALAEARSLPAIVRLNLWHNRLGRVSEQRLRARFGPRVDL